MAYQVLARKWRPHNFTQLVGQQHVSQSLSNALQHDRLHHAYLFTGTRGVGKTTIARILARAINCENLQDANPCGECSVCRAFDAGSFMDLIEVDAASRTKVEDTRDLLDNAQYAPNQGRYKVYLIDEVHMLSGHSFNALLKTLEEPPPHVKFLLATTDPQKIPVTVLSRCLQFNLKRLSPEQIDQQMQYILTEEQIEYDLAALQALAKAADGSLRDALSLLDQAIAFGDGKVCLQTVNDMLGIVAQQPVDNILIALANNEAVELLQTIADMAELTPDYVDVVQQILAVLHRVALQQTVPNFVDKQFDAEIIDGLAEKLSAEDVQLYYQIALIGLRDLELAPDMRSGFEMIMLRMLSFKPVIESDTVLVQAKSHKMSKTVATVSPVDKSSPSIDVVNAVEEKPEAAARQSEAVWPEIVVAIRVTGMTRELANNCVLASVDDQYCRLVLTPGHEQLHTNRCAERLQAAIQKYYGKAIKLDISSGESEQATPAQRKVQQQADRQQAAVDAINSDGTVQSLKDNLSARVMPGTIEPLS